MGKILEVFKENRDVILRDLSQNLPQIVHLLQGKGVYKEEETHGLLKDKPYLVVYAIFSHVDAGGYYDEFVDALTEAGVFGVAELVRLADCSFIKKLEDRNVADIGSDVTLSCCLDEEYAVRWYKDQSEIFMNDKFRFKDEQCKHQLIIADIQEEDLGVYSCECGTTKTRCVLKVEANRFIKQLEDVTISTGQKLILDCELDAECKNVKWYKTNGGISYWATITDFKIADSNAHRYKLEIKRVKIEDAGEYSCYNENCITTCDVTVKRTQEIQIDDSVPTTTLLYELKRTKVRNDELLNTRTKLNRAATDVNQRERETGISELRARLHENMLICRESELENKKISETMTEANRFIKQLEDVTITTGQKLILACELNAECKNVKWYKTNGDISYRATTTDVRLAGSNTHRYKLELNPVKLEDTGEYSCHNENAITTCNVTVKRTQELQIDNSVPTTTLLYELKRTKERLKVRNDELSNTRTKLNRAATDVNKKEIIIKENETEITELRARLKEQENMLKCRDSELESKDKYIQVLEDKNQQLTESVKKLELTYKELESTKQLLAQVQEQIEKLEGEKQHLEVRIITLESYINDGKINEQQQKVLEKMMEDCFFTTKLEDRNAIGISSDVTLSCCLDKEYGVRWYKDQREIFQNDRFKFKDERLEHKLIITDIQEEDAGVYSCQCGTTETSCKLKVKADRFIKQLEDVTITNGEELILACELKAECKEVQWCKTNGTISDWATTTDNRIGGSNAHMYKLDINSVKMEDAGEYSCHNGNVITTCNVTVKEIKIDASLNTTTLLHDLSSIKRRIKVKKDEILNTRTNLDRTETDVNQKEIIIEKRETEIAELRTQLKEQENMLKCRDIELESKEQYIQVLKDTNQQLAESVEKLELTLKELESTKQQSKQMQQRIKKLEGEKQDMEDRVKTLESYIDDGKNNKQQQKANEEQRKANEQQRKAQEQLQKASEQQQKVLEDMRTMTEEKSKVCSVS